MEQTLLFVMRFVASSTYAKLPFPSLLPVRSYVPILFKTKLLDSPITVNNHSLVACKVVICKQENPATEQFASGMCDQLGSTNRRVGFWSHAPTIISYCWRLCWIQRADWFVNNNSRPDACPLYARSCESQHLKSKITLPSQTHAIS